MSSILKALKKIEESAPPEESLNPAQAFHPRTVFGHRPRGRFLTAKTLYVGLAAVVALAAGILIQGWMSGEADPRDGKPAAADSAPAGGGAFRAKLPDPKTAAPAPPVAAPPPSGQAESAAAPAPIPAGAPGATAAERPVPPAQAARALPKETPPAPGASAQRPARPRETPPLSRPPAARTPEDNLSRLDDSKLKVMAIAWHGDAARRIAVINGHIVKEGESVDGYTVSRIRKNDVIVNDGSRSWRAEFALKIQP